MLFEQAIIAKAELEGDGLSVGLINVRSLKPFDRNALLDAVKQSEFLVTLEDHFKTGGLYSIIAEILLENTLSVKAIPLALDERWFRPGPLEAVLQYEGFTGKQIAQRIRTAIKRNGKQCWV
jgi:transketolase